MGLDSECDIAVEATDDETRAAIRAFRAREIGHFMGREPEDVVAAIKEHGSVGRAIEALDTYPHRRLKPIEKADPGRVARFVASWSLGDPLRTDDAWRPWVRRAHLRRDMQRLLPNAPSHLLEG
jgi:hypothetical protein